MYSLLPVACCLLPVAFERLRYPNLNAEQLKRVRIGRLVRMQGDLCARRGLLLGSKTMEGYSVIQAEVPLKEMFGYSTAVRSLCSGQASFTMELATYLLSGLRRVYSL